MKKTLAPILAAAVVAASSVAWGQALEDPIPEPIESAGPPIALEPIADGLTAPNWGTASPVDPNRLFVTDQDGILWAIDLTTQDKHAFLDVSDRLVSLGVAGPGSFDERGLLGVAFHPDYASNGFLYTYTSQPVDGAADFSTLPSGATANHQSVIAEWRVPDPDNPVAVVDPGTRREVLRIDEPQFNHNAGALNFGPDGMLYISLGDGGAADDQGVGHVPGGNGQDHGNVLGTILRIDPDGSNSANGQYGIPADNPFVEQAGFAEEIFAYGFRNPFRFSFDMKTGDLFCADVGQNDIEEVDVVVAGGNYGWRIKEGSFCFDANGSNPGFVTAGDCGPPGLIDPIAEYDHDEGIAIVGGFVYRGSRIKALRGRYIFGDYFNPPDIGGRLFFLKTPNHPAGPQTSEIAEMKLVDGSLGRSVLGFGQDAYGEVYVLANSTGTPFGDTGVVMRIAPAHGRAADDHVGGAADKEPTLGSAVPNPFNPVTRIHYALPEEHSVTLSVYDVGGRLVERLVSGVQPSGEHVVEWNAVGVASGLYFYRLEAGSFVESRKMILLK